MACRLLGERSRNAEDRPLLEILHRENIFERVREAVESGGTPELDKSERYLSNEREGNVRHREIVFTAVRPWEGEDIHGEILMLRDVTQSKELDRMKSEFVATGGGA